MDENGWTAFEEAEPEESACLYGTLLIWHVYRGVVVERFEDIHNTLMNTHWQAMPRRGWIATAERKPEREDANDRGCVLARHAHDGITVTGWHRFISEPRLTHWMKTPGPPADREKYRERFE